MSVTSEAVHDRADEHRPPVPSRQDTARRPALRPVPIALSGGSAPVIRRAEGARVTSGLAGTQVTTWSAKVIPPPHEAQAVDEHEQELEAQHGANAGAVIRELRARTAVEAENRARDLPVKYAVVNKGQGAPHKAHWSLMLGYGQDDAPTWLKVDLIEAGYRLIWNATNPGGEAVALQGTIGTVLEAARDVAKQNTLYLNPDDPDAVLEQQGKARYSCQHFVVKLAARFGAHLEAPVVK